MVETNHWLWKIRGISRGTCFKYNIVRESSLSRWGARVVGTEAKGSELTSE